MTCYHPIQAWRSKQGYNRFTRRWPIVFKRNEGYIDKELKIPCGKCIGCRLEYSRQWAIRAYHESKTHQDNCFICLTYEDQNGKTPTSLVPEDLTKFFKRLRKHYPEKKNETSIRYLACGEYGENFSRPHYHACLFGHDFTDREPIGKSSSGETVYTSDTLEGIWGFGIVSVQDFTWETAAYCARYIIEKMTGNQMFTKREWEMGPDGKPHQYRTVYQNSGEYYNGRTPEFVRMSRRPGLGSKWYAQFKDDIYNYDECIIRKGVKARAPRFYDKMFEGESRFYGPGNRNELNLKMIDEFDLFKHRREIRVNKTEQTSDRLAVREKIKLQKIKKLNRSLENASSLLRKG